MTPTTITRKSGRCASIDVKRFYTPFVIEASCPQCGERVKRDCDDHYFSYPPLGVPFNEGMWCSGCEHEWDVRIQLDITLALASEPNSSDKGSP